MTHVALICRKRLPICLVVAVLSVLGTAGCGPSVPNSQAAAELESFVGQIDAQPLGATGEMKTFALVAVNSYDKLMGGVNFLGSLIGMRDANMIAEAQVLKLIQDKGLAAIDKNRPWGALLQSDGMGYSVFALVPTAKPDDLFAIVAANGIQINQNAAGMRELTLPNGMSVFAKSEGGWTLVSDSEQSLGRAPANFQADLTRLSGEYDLAASLLVQNLPEMARQMVIGGIRSGAEMALQPRPGETAEQTQIRRQATENEIEHFEKALQEVDKLTVGMKIDTTAQRAYFDMAVEVVPGTDLAKQLQAQGEARTSFAGFRQSDAAAMLSFTTQADPASLQEMRANRDAARQAMLKAIDENEDIPAAMREAVKSAASDFFDAAMATAETGKIDVAAALRVAPDSLTLVAAARVKDTEKLVSGFKKLEAAVKQQAPDAPGVKWNAAEQGGVAFHTLNIPLRPDADAAIRRMIGDEIAVALGIGQEAAYLAIGRDHLAVVQKAIEASLGEEKSAPMFELALSLRPLITLAAAHADDPQAKMSLEMVGASLQNVAGGRDHIRNQCDVIPNGQRVRFEAEQGALQALAQGVMMAQMRAMGGQ